ncbi:protein archease-like [Diadema setosum]|uniref:protein archease-like n=1 Tax=Diadema setosum TaxID=31175 RepID=UPI003B3ACB7B
MASAEGAENVDKVSEGSQTNIDEAAADIESATGPKGGEAAEVPAGATGGAGNNGAAAGEMTDEQLHNYAGHEHAGAGNYPLYEDRKPVGNYEYLDHTADVQLHSWGSSLKESFEAVVLAMFDYMTDIKYVEKTITKEVTAEGDDLKSLLYHFLDEWLFVFSTDPFFIPREVTIDEFDEKNFTIKSTGTGEYFDIVKHPQGTEVKAITYSNMQIHESGQHDVYVIIDI